MSINIHKGFDLQRFSGLFFLWLCAYVVVFYVFFIDISFYL